MRALLIAVVLASLKCTLQSPVQVEATDKRVVCFYSSWAVYRPDNGAFAANDLDPFLCTHAVYAFAGIDNETHKIISLDPYNDLPDNYGKGQYLVFNNLSNSNPELKTLLGVGGYNEGSQKYSIMASTEENRQAFVSSAVSYLQKYGFDGLVLDWEYPSYTTDDKANYVTLLSELQAAFKPQGLLLSVSAPAGQVNIDAGYDVPGISQSVDFLLVMAYDYHGTWEPYTGLNAPLFPSPSETGANLTLNADWTISYYIQLGAPLDKITLGMASYGHNFQLADPQQHGFYAPTLGPGAAGPYLKSPGTVGYNELCVNLPSWTVKYDDSYQGPYAFDNDQWVGYDDVQSITAKCQYVIDNNLGGAVLWSVDTDDFHGTCGGQPFTLLSTINEQLRSSALKKINR